MSVLPGRDVLARDAVDAVVRKHLDPGPEFAQAVDVVDRILDNVELVVRGKREQVKLVLCALVCGGHVLFEDVPGTAKTVLARALAGSVDGARASRIQCTPDLQPTDVTGLSVFDQRERVFEFRPGPLFSNIVLVDEINRAMPRTQSALLEAMAERQVTVDGVTRVLPDPFLVVATENPLDHEGTFPLPEAQLDRFFLKAALGYPSRADELGITAAQRGHHPLRDLRPAVTLDELRVVQRAVEQVHVDPLVHGWLVDLVRATRELDVVEVGASVRGSLALDHAARAWALVHGRPYVEPGDVEHLFAPVLGHRIVVNHYRAGQSAEGPVDLLAACLSLAPRPTTGIAGPPA